MFLAIAPQLCIISPFLIVIHKILEAGVELGLGVSQEKESKRGDTAVVVVHGSRVGEVDLKRVTEAREVTEARIKSLLPPL